MSAIKKRIFVVTEKHSNLAWFPIGPAIDRAEDDYVQEAIRGKYKPGDTIPPLFLVTVEAISVTQQVHAVVEADPE